MCPYSPYLRGAIYRINTLQAGGQRGGRNALPFTEKLFDPLCSATCCKLAVGFHKEQSGPTLDIREGGRGAGNEVDFMDTKWPRPAVVGLVGGTAGQRRAKLARLALWAASTGTELSGVAEENSPAKGGEGASGSELLVVFGRADELGEGRLTRELAAPARIDFPADEQTLLVEFVLAQLDQAR